MTLSRILTPLDRDTAATLGLGDNVGSMEKAHWTGRQITVAAALAVMALLIRLYYVNTAIVDHPLRGDAAQYVTYAINLLDSHVFSMQAQESPLPDGFRDPGYPFFLAVLTALAGRGQGFYLTVLNLQCVLSATTVGVYIVLARRWLGMAAAIAVGLGMALWPHAITLSGYLLSETLIGFLFAVALWLLQQACDRASTRLGAASGLTFALAALTNATLLPVVPLFALLAIWRDRARRTLWIAFLVAALVPAMAWALRGASLPPAATDKAGDRIAMNFVQGSWPEYHAAWYSSLVNGDEASKAVMRKIDSDYSVLRTNHVAGLERVASRISAEPLRYARWYAGKPVELWGWVIGIGMGDIYVYPTFESPLSGHGVLRFTTDFLFFANPLLMLLALAGFLGIAIHARRQPAALLLATLAVTVLTAIFTLLQADARYAAPYRGIEWVLAAAGCLWLGRLYRKTRDRRHSSPQA